MKAKYLKEFITFPDVMVMSTLFLLSTCFTVYNMSSAAIWIAIAAGMVTYITGEYFTHRFLFHLKTPKNPFFLKLLKRLHYDHHSNPNELHLLFLPLWYSVPNFAIVGAIVYVITTKWIITNAFLTGMMLFFLFYEWKHYIAHRPIQPVTKWGKWMKKVHLWHHFNNENYWFGVTNPSFDYLMGTFKDREKVEKSPTARNLEKRGEHIQS
ncbi:sterol desaturase family protein [Paenibacillus sediminis]|uniref:Sterol desaturase/sphingolipid hydroxylase (Fatty acid hydroxylase superfamily) n=1 Tax=Paenibacillus sediminis TaxID=664909 RepID=A0ABS4H0N1_9BACL|nr:sterol desaturase family protein [Paenibacillus sediminis]MBP1936093.1 sterol desaturase/sphingolipid hydroxylase (fatty acid hydroxylase superfamily) [Paenibacillus sediminis]